MKKALSISAIALAGLVQAQSVQTAPVGDLGLNAPVVTNVTFDGLLTEHQDISGKADKTNVYTKGETDARIVELAPRTSLEPATNYVNDLERRISDGLLKAGTAGQADRAYEADTASSASRADMADVAYSAVSADNAQYADTAYNLATSESGGEDYRTAESIFQQLDGAATKSELQAVSNESAIVARLYMGSNVVDEVTNYNSAVNMPTRRMYQLNESNEYVKVWDENTRHTNTLALAKSYADEIGTNYAPRAWGRTTSGYGAEAPEGTTWLSSPTTVIAGGYEYEKHATAGGAIWLLTSKGAAFDFSPSTNNTAYLNIAAQDGTPIFRIEKTDSYLVGVAADAVSMDGPSTLVVGFDVVAASTPLVRVCTNLSDHVWLKQEDGIPAGYATVEWSGTSGDYECRITNNTGGNSLFAYFEYLQEGGVKIVNGVATDISGGIIVNGVHYSTVGTATIDGHTVLTLGN